MRDKFRHNAVGCQFLLQRSNNFHVFSAPEEKSRCIETRYARMTRIPRISTKFPKRIATAYAAVQNRE